MIAVAFQQCSAYVIITIRLLNLIEVVAAHVNGCNTAQANTIDGTDLQISTSGQRISHVVVFAWFVRDFPVIG